MCLAFAIIRRGERGSGLNGRPNKGGTARQGAEEEMERGRTIRVGQNPYADGEAGSIVGVVRSYAGRISNASDRWPLERPLSTSRAMEC